MVCYHITSVHNILGRVKVGFQPDPVDYHATNIMVVDDLRGPRVQPDGTGRRVRSGLRAGHRVDGLPYNRPHGPWNRPFRLPSTSPVGHLRFI